MTAVYGTVDKVPPRLSRTGAKLAAHLRAPLYREGYALILSAALASALGFAYWVVAAHTYSTEAVGLNAALISTMTLVSGIAQLDLVGGLLRFIPDAGRSTFRLVGWSYLVSMAAAAVAAPLFLLGVHWWTPRLGVLTSSTGYALWFAGATMAWCVFSLQDAVLTGLRRATWVPVDNALFGVVKLALLVGLAASFPRFGIFASWTLGAMLSVVLISIVLAVRLIPERTRTSIRESGAVTARQIGRFVAADYAGGLSWILAITVIPLAVTQRLGASANAYYSLAWVMMTPLYLVSLSTSNSLVVALVNEQRRFREYPRDVLRQTARLVVPGAIVLAAGAPLFLRLFGEDYARHGSSTLQLLALSAIPNMVTTLYLSVWRAEQRLSLLVWVRVIQYAAVVAVSLPLLDREGIRAPAIAWLVVQTIAAGVLVLRWPHVLTRSGSPLSWKLRGIRVLRNAAADSGLLTLSREVRWRPDSRRRLERVARVVPRVLDEIPEREGDPPSTAWVVHALPRTSNDKTFVLVGPPKSPPRALIKLADTGTAASALAGEARVLDELAADPRLAEWRRLLPEVIASGEIDGEPFLVEAIVPGTVASRLLGNGSAPAALLGTLAEAIEGLHELTGSEYEIEEANLLLWVDVPLATLAFRLARQRTRVDRQLRALDRLRGDLYEGLMGRKTTAGWIHGDYGPGNIVVASATGPVTGIVDWELAATQSMTALDLVQLVLSVRMLTQRRELGEIVTATLASGWTEPERAVLDRVVSRPASPGLRELVLLAWLRHTATMLSASEAYAGHRLWMLSNVETTLTALA